MNPSDENIDSLAAEWVGRRDAGLTEAELAELAAWRAADPRHSAALLRFERIWSVADRPRQLGANDRVRAQLARRATRRRRFIAGAGLAATLLLGLGSWIGLRSPDAETITARTAFLGPYRLNLPDGSVAEYSAGTRIVVDFSATARRLSFTGGEAHFDVTHDPARPFIVTAGGLAVRAVGTAFSVQVGSGSTDVLVTAGRVAVNPAEASPAAPATPLAFVDAGQAIAVVIPSAGDPATVQSIPVNETPARLAWRQRRVEFSSTPLGEVIAVVNRHNEVQFTISDAEVARIPLSGIFRLDDPDELARLLESGFALEVARPAPGRIVLGPRR
jgi:transmembrane sensor